MFRQHWKTMLNECCPKNLFLGNEKYMTDCHFVQDEPQSNTVMNAKHLEGGVELSIPASRSHIM